MRRAAGTAAQNVDFRLLSKVQEQTQGSLCEEWIWIWKAGVVADCLLISHICSHLKTTVF